MLSTWPLKGCGPTDLKSRHPVFRAVMLQQEWVAQAAQGGLLSGSRKTWEARGVICPYCVGTAKSLLGLRLEIGSLVGIKEEPGEEGLSISREVRDQVKISRNQALAPVPELSTFVLKGLIRGEALNTCMESRPTCLPTPTESQRNAFPFLNRPK